jgi:hypothetical protein
MTKAGDVLSLAFLLARLSTSKTVVTPDSANVQLPSVKLGGSLKAVGLGDGRASVAGEFPFSGLAIPKLRLRLPPGMNTPKS